MKKILTASVSLLFVMVFAFSCFAGAVPPGDGTRTGAVSDETQTEEYTTEETGETEETEETDEEYELPEGSLAPDEYYYITREEFEEYRDEFADLSFREVMGPVFEDLGFEFLSIFAPLMAPLLFFVPFGPLVAGAFLVAPFSGAYVVFDELKEAFHYLFHKREVIESFSVENLYAEPVVEYVASEDGSDDRPVVTGYEVKYTPWPFEFDYYTNCRRVAIKE